MSDSEATRATVTGLLLRWRDERTEIGDELVEAVYPVLEQIARSSLRREPVGHTLQTRALVHEAFMKLADQDRIEWAGRRQFYAVASQTMRRLLVDHARRKKSGKRGGDAEHVELDEAWMAPDSSSDVDLVALDDALRRLAERDEKKAQIIELRFFGGFSHEEIAEILDVSLSTVERQWRMARAWLFDALKA